MCGLWEQPLHFGVFACLSQVEGREDLGAAMLAVQATGDDRVSVSIQKQNDRLRDDFAEWDKRLVWAEGARGLEGSKGDGEDDQRGAPA